MNKYSPTLSGILSQRRLRRLGNQKTAFTLIELLVVIAIIAILAAVLFPVFAAVRENARQSACASNMRQINMAFSQYAQEYDEQMPPHRIKVPPINGGNDNNVPYDSLLASYVKSDGVYACPDDAVPRSQKSLVWDGAYLGRLVKRSYSMTSLIATQEGTLRGDSPDSNTGIADHSLAQFGQPSETISLVESWGTAQGISDSIMGSISGSYLYNCDTWKLPGRTDSNGALIADFPPCNGDYSNVQQQPPSGHHRTGNYAFVDGHIKNLRWDQVRNDDFYLFKLQKPQQKFTP